MIILIITALVSLGLLILAFRSYRRKRLVDDTPTSKTQGVFLGMSELKGAAESDSPLKSYLAGVKCVYYKWKIEEHWSRWTTDSKGRVHKESGWTNVANGTEFEPFYLKDESGLIQVNPEGASVTCKETLEETCTESDPLYFGKGPAEEILNSDHRRRFHESALPLHVQLYVMGQARERQDVVAAEIAKDKSAPMFLISTKTEKQISRSFGIFFWLWLVLGLLVAGGGVFALQVTQGNTSGYFSEGVIIAAVAYLFAAGLGWLWTVYNSLIVLRQRVKQGWSQVDVEIKRRHDLIPNLVKAVEGYRSHEQVTQTLVTELRTQAFATAPGVAGPDYKGLLPLLKATMEQYPELKSNELFLGLQKSLTETEQRIALARDYFNDVATYYNTRLQIIPDRFVAWMAYMKPELLLSASEFERALVQVKLAE